MRADNIIAKSSSLCATASRDNNNARDICWPSVFCASGATRPYPETPVRIIIQYAAYHLIGLTVRHFMLNNGSNVMMLA